MSEHWKTAEWIEGRAAADIADAASSFEGIDMAADEIDGALVLSAPGIDHVLFNRVLGVGVEHPASEAAVESILGRLAERQVGSYLFQLCPMAAPSEIAGWLRGRGLGPFHRGWDKFVRDTAPVDGPRDVRVARVETAEQAARFGAIVAAGFELDQELAPLIGTLGSRPGWQLFLAEEGEHALGTGALYVQDGVAYLTFGATHPDHRGRGVHRQVMARRLEEAREMGCRLVVTETGKPVEGLPNHSYQNMLRSGFRTPLPALQLRTRRLTLSGGTTMNTNPTNHWTLSRRLVAASAAVTAGIIWTQALGALTRHLGPADTPLLAMPLTVAAALVSLAGAVAWPRRWAPLLSLAAAGVAVAALQSLTPGAWASASALFVTGPAVSLLGLALGRRLPDSVDTVGARRPAVVVVWGLLALSMVVQTGRLATFMRDPSFDWYLTTRHPFWAKHECMPAYIYGAELSARGVENVYDAAHYPGLNPQAAPHTDMVDMAPEDPFQYAPQFLLLPRAAVAMTSDYPTIRLVWFGIQTTFFVAVAAGLALWVGGVAGRMGLWLLPLAFTAFPALHNFQYGQFHLAGIALAVGGMLALERRRRALGGLMIAAAVCAKIFPGIVLVILAVQRRWRDLALVPGRYRRDHGPGPRHPGAGSLRRVRGLSPPAPAERRRVRVR